MDTKSLLIGIISFLAGGLLVSTAAVTFNKPDMANNTEMTMSQMTESLATKKGDEFDKLFITYMIDHHEGAVAMAKLSEGNAKHDEIKKLSGDIVSAQESEIVQMRQWQKDWGYEIPDSNSPHTSH